MKRKTIFYMVGLVLLAIFVIQNFAQVNVSFLLWEITLPRSLVLIIVFSLGLGGGYGLAEFGQHHRRKQSS